MLSHPLLPKLRQLKLSGILDTLETGAAQATRDQLSPTEFLAILLDDELGRRDQAKLARRVTASGVDPTKTLASFDFAAVPAPESHARPRPGHRQLRQPRPERPALRPARRRQDPLRRLPRSGSRPWRPRRSRSSIRPIRSMG
jgi:hypothetical protein